MMKCFFMFFGGFLTAILLGIIISGTSKCSEEPEGEWISHGNCVDTKIITIENHKYILMDGSYSGGIIHAMSCPCLDKR